MDSDDINKFQVGEIVETDEGPRIVMEGLVGKYLAELDSDAESDDEIIFEELKPASVSATPERRSRLLVPQIQKPKVMIRENCDSNFENCVEVSRETIQENLPENVETRIKDYVCEGDVCSAVNVVDIDKNNRVSSRRGSSISSVRMSNSSLKIIEPQPVLIEPYSTADTGVPQHILAFVNAPGASRFSKPHKSMGKWFMWGSDSCKYCEMAKKLLSDYNQRVHYLDKNMTTEDQKRWLLSKNVDLDGTVPQIFLNNTLIGGYTELRKFLETKM